MFLPKKESKISRVCKPLKTIFAFVLGLLLPSVFLIGNSPAYGQSKTDTLTYTVKPGDHLMKIAVNHGSPNFWIDIYEANADQIEDPNLIYPEQQFIIPSSIVESPKFIGKYKHPKNTDSLEDQDQLKKFREAFTKLIEEETQPSKKQNPQSNGLEFGGLVIDETRSKLGKDFFNIFYRYWEAPTKAPNFMLAISEKPLPSIGTIVTVKLDNQAVYQSRLQPRYEKIEEQAKQAVAISYRSLQQKLQTETQLIQY